MAKGGTLQLEFIARIKEMLPASISFVDEIADVLGLSNDSAYRRIRGETSLTLEEIVNLCNHFKISFDSFRNQSEGLVTFNYQPLVYSEDGFFKYLSNMLKDLKKIEAFDSKQITFAAEDIPVFHHFSSAELTSFKIFYWNRSILNASGLQDKKFELGKLDKQTEEITKGIIDAYSKIPSIEIWSEDTITGTLKQIEFYWDSGLFQTKEDALLICREFEKLIEGIRKQAEASAKSGSMTENYIMYNSDVTIGNNCILVNMGDVKATYLSHHTFNAMITTNASFCDETDLWLKNLIKKSTMISGVGEKQRYQFFKKINESVERLKEKMK